MKYHVGCGKRNFGPDWVHVDVAEYSHIQSKDIFLQGIIQADLIYSSHMLEYFDRKEAANLLVCWNLSLKKGGMLRIAVPDFKAISDLYHACYPLDKLLGLLYGKMDLNGKNIYHKSVYDFDSLKSLLEKCGFSSVRKYNWRKTEHSEFDDHSQAYIPHMDKDGGRLMSLNVEAIK